MYNLLIVDDEMLIADGVYAALEDENIDGLNLMKAYHVLDALDMAANRHIDILLTDIKMPEMNGFMLYEKVKERWRNCKVIFLTGFESFDYAYKAIQYKDVHYIIKADGVSSVIKTVREVAQELDALYASKQSTHFDLVQEVKKQFIKQRFYEYFNRNIEKEDLNMQQLSQIGLNLDLNGSLTMVGLRIIFENNVTYDQLIQNMNDINSLFINHMEKTFNIMQIESHKVMIWLLQLKDHGKSLKVYNDSYIKNLLELFQMNLKNALDIECVSVILDAASLKHIREEYGDFKIMLLGQTLENGNLMNYEDLKEIAKEKIIKPLSDEICMQLSHNQIERIDIYLERQLKDAFLTEIDPFLESLGNIKSMHNTYARELYMQISLRLLNYINKTELLVKLPFEIAITPLTSLEEFKDWEEAAAYLRKIINIIFRVNREAVKLEQNLFISKIESYVKENIEQNISITELADMLHFNPYYLSRMFKKVKNINLSDYIVEEKMNRAKKLLETTDIKVQEIGERLGYSTPTNFIRTFKKFYGETPNEFKKNLINLI